MNLRPHHLLCIQKFTGHGYDEAFTKHLTGIVAHLTDRPETEITLTHGCDYVCLSCPNKKNEICMTEEKVLRMDNGVLETSGFHYGETVSWTELSRRAREIFLSDRFEKICNSCEWYELCKSTEVTH